MKKKISFSFPNINTKYTLNLIKKTLTQGFPNEGSLTEQFEKKISKILKVKYALSTTSGTTALYLGLKALGVGFGDEVIVPNITFPATANAVKMSGAKPVLVDVDKKDLLLDLKSVKNAISKKTKVIIPVHISGRGNNIVKLKKLASKYKILILEDAAESLFSKYKNFFLGTFGKAGCFSLAPNKIITTGQGGIVVTNDKLIFTRLKYLKDQGRKKKSLGGDDFYYSEGYNFKFTDLQASLGLSQLKNLAFRKQKLKKIYNYYFANIIQDKNFKIYKFNNEEIPLWTDVWCKNRDKLYYHLLKKNIITRKYWKPLNLSRPSNNRSDKKFKNSKALNNKLLWLPSALNLDEKDLSKICKSVNSFYRREKNA